MCPNWNEFAAWAKNKKRLLSSTLRRLPDVVIVGAQKSGTTSLYNYLGEHPKIHKGITKEVHYFDENYDRSRLWYRSHFPIRRDGLTLEATPRYMFHRDAFERIKEVIPGAKCVAVVREPVERAYSHYRHVCRGMGQFGRESRSFEEAVRADRKILEEEGRILGNGSYEDVYHSYIRRGIYAPQLERFLDFYGDQLLVIPSWKLFEEPRSTMVQVFRHVGCKPIQVEGKAYNEAGYDDDIPKAQKLERLFQPYNRQLYDLVGSSEWWKY